MNAQELAREMQKRPYLVRQGASKTAKRFKTTVETVKKARTMFWNNKEVKPLRILLFDIETAPMRAYVWKRWKENISLEQTISEWFCIAWSAKWLYSGDVLGDVLTPEEILKEDDSRIMTNLWNLINQADIIVAHNGDKFDIPKINARFALNNLPPYKPVFSVDTLKVAKYRFGFSSNKLDALAGYFGIPHKLDTDFNLWKRCMEGDKEALGYMLKYNKMDVKILEEVYLKLRPWIKGHPNISNLYHSDKESCGICGNEDLELIEGEYYFTSVNCYPLYRCKHCGAISRGRKSITKPSDIKIVNVGK